MSQIWQLSIEELNPLCNIFAKLLAVFQKNFLSRSNDLFLTSLLQWFSLWNLLLHCFYVQISDIIYGQKNQKSNSCSIWSFFGHLERIWMSSFSQVSSVIQSCPALCDPMDCSTPGLPVHHHLPELTQTHVHRVRDAIQPSRPLSFLPPSILPSIRVFSNESALCIRWPKYWSFSLRISPSNDYSGLISFRIDRLDLLAGQGTLKSLLQQHS